MDAALEQDIWDSTPIQGERVFQSEDGSLQVRVGSLGGPGEAQHLLVQRWQTEEKRDLLRHVALDPTEALLSQLPVEAGDPVLLARLSNGAELAVVNQEDRGNFEALGAALNDVAERIEPRPTLDPSPQSASLWIMAAGLTPMELETILEVLPHRIASKFAGYGGALDLMLDYGTSLTRGQLASASDSIQTYLGVTAVEQPEIEADPEDAPEPEDAKPPQPSRDDLTPFLSDAAAPSLDADALDRAAIARAVAEKVRQVWPNHYQPGGSGSPFIVHLSGRWGSGKSSILSFLRDILQKEHREPWVVVHYNAWSKSQAGHAWWSMFNALIKQASPQLDPVRRIRLRLSDWWWRFRVGRQSLILTLLVLATLGLGLFALDQLRPAEPQASDYGPQPPIEDTVIVIEQVTPLEDGSGTRTETTTLTNEPPPEPDTGGLPQDFWALIALVGSGLTTLVAIINGVSFLRGRSAKTERTMHVLDGDHTGPMKDRFRKSIRVIGRPVAFCIDDLDRCDADYVVELLQVLQTVYAEVPVLYVIAADRDWLVSAYGQSYQAFDKDLKQPGQSLGDLFLEKIFQLSVTVPDLSPLDKERYIAALTGPSKAPPQRNEAQDAALRIEFGLAAPKGVDALREVTEKAVKEGAGQRARELAFETLLMADTLKSIKHQLAAYEHLMDPNPRAIKRLLNSYSFRQGYAFLAGQRLDADQLIRWSILDLRFPLVARALVRDPQGWRDDIGPFDHADLTELTDGFSPDQIRLLSRFG